MTGNVGLRMVIILNGPLGIGKSTLAEALTESIDKCVLLDGDHLIAGNPPPVDGTGYLHSTIELLIAHHRRWGYQHFVIDHIWRTPAELADLQRRLSDIDVDQVRCFLLTLPLEENLRRIARRQGARALDEAEFEREAVAEERDVLYTSVGTELGEPFDVSASPTALVAAVMRRTGLTS